MDRIWLKNYPAGVPHEVNPGQYRSLTELIEESLRKNAARPFTVCMDRWMSYGELDELSAALGAWLQSQGLEPGARVAIMLPNVPQFTIAYFGAHYAACPVVPLNVLLTGDEVAYHLTDSEAQVLVLWEGFYEAGAAGFARAECCKIGRAHV